MLNVLNKSSSFAVEDNDSMDLLWSEMQNSFYSVLYFHAAFSYQKIGLSGWNITCVMYLDTILAGLFVESECNLILSLEIVHM